MKEGIRHTPQRFHHSNLAPKRESRVRVAVVPDPAQVGIKSQTNVPEATFPPNACALRDALVLDSRAQLLDWKRVRDHVRNEFGNELGHAEKRVLGALDTLDAVFPVIRRHEHLKKKETITTNVKSTMFTLR
jgi:hypothetical protein